MDFNNLNLRLKRISNALGKQYELDIKSNTKIKREVSGDIHRIGFIFGNFGEEELVNRIMSAISMVASLKDHLKTKLKKINESPNLVEEMINNSEELKIIIDLSNQEKHGYPLEKFKRSKLNPRIINISQGLSIKDGGKASVSFTISGNEAVYDSSDNASIQITGEVVDEHGNFIISVEDLLNRAMVTIEKFLQTNNLI